MLITLLAAGVAAAVIAGDRPTTSAGPETDRVASAAADLGQLRYQIVTRSGADEASCRAATPRVWPAVIGVPAYVRAGNSLLPDTVVELGVAPGTAGTTIVDLSVDRLSTKKVLAQVEVVVAPVAGGSERISFGYDGCEAGAPAVFDEAITTSPVRLALKTATSQPMPALTLIGSEFTQASDGTRTVSRTVSARMAPMPISVYTSVNQTAPDSYFAEIRARQGTNVRLDHSQTGDDGSRSAVSAEIGSFPGGLDIQLTPTLIDYTATDPFDQPLSRPVDLVDIETITTAPGDPEKRLRARLEGVPATGRLERTSPTRVEVTAPQGPIGAATVSYSSVPEGTAAVPVLAPVGDQYLVARKVHDLLVAQVRVLDLSHAVIDAGDPLAGADPETDLQTDKVPTVVEATHRAGLFTIDAAVTSRPPTSPVDVTRTALARVVELPSTARVEFGATTQSFEYRGSADIDLLTVDVASSEPFVDDAKVAHLTVTDFPTGLVGRFDEKGKRFTARVPGGQVGLIELQATSGPDLRLPVGVDGVLLEDHEDRYTAFARVSGLRRITVGWADTMLADVAHAPGPFDVLVDIDDPDTAAPGEDPTDLDVALNIRDLPGTARFGYTPGKPDDCPHSECSTATSLTFAGDARVGNIDLDVVSGTTLVPSAEQGRWGFPGNVGADEMHLALRDVPSAPGYPADPTVNSLALTVDGTAKHLAVDVADSDPGLDVELEACSDGQCGQPVYTGKLPTHHPATQDGIWLSDHRASYHLLARLSGLDDVGVSWGDDVVVHAVHDAGAFDIVTQEEKRAYGLLPGPGTPYVADTSVAISNLPSTVDLTYERDNQTVHYDGADVIGSIEAWRWLDRTLVIGDEVVGAVAGRATNAHLLVQGLPSNVDLTFDFGLEADNASVDTGGPAIGRVELELLSDDALRGALAASPIVGQGFDGLELWDLDDQDTDHFEPVHDPYAIVVRATDLTKFRYETNVVGTSEDFQIEENTFVDIERTSGPDLTSLWAQVRKTNTQKAAENIPGLAKSYQFETTRLDFGGAPAKLGLAMYNIRKNNSALHQILLDYWASGPGSQLDFETTALEFKRTMVDVKITGDAGVPGGGGTPESPGVRVCLGPNNMRCGPHDRVGGEGQMSYSVQVASPVTANVTALFPTEEVPDDDDEYQKLTLENVRLDNGLTLSREKDGGGDHFVYADTAGGYVQGTVKLVHHNAITHETDRALYVVLPPGTYAIDRYVEVEAIDTGVDQGVMGCPVGIVMEAEAEGIDFDVTDDMCTGAVVTGVSSGGSSPAVLVPGQETVLTVTGTSFVSPWVESDGTAHRGTRVYFPWPPQVSVLHLAWISPTELEVTVYTEPDAQRGTWIPIGVDNPVQDPNIHWCQECVRVAD